MKYSREISCVMIDETRYKRSSWSSRPSAREARRATDSPHEVGLVVVAKHHHEARVHRPTARRPHGRVAGQRRALSAGNRRARPTLPEFCRQACPPPAEADHSMRRCWRHNGDPLVAAPSVAANRTTVLDCRRADQRASSLPPPQTVPPSLALLQRPGLLARLLRRRLLFRPCRRHHLSRPSFLAR